MSDNRKYYYLKLKEDYFDDDSIVLLESMIEAIEDGYIGAVMVKDMSRLGRDYLQVGLYTDQFFPEQGVRFIAVNDGVDSAEGENEFAPFRNIMNEW